MDYRPGQIINTDYPQGLAEKLFFEKHLKAKLNFAAELQRLGSWDPTTDPADFRDAVVEQFELLAEVMKTEPSF